VDTQPFHLREVHKPIRMSSPSLTDRAKEWLGIVGGAGAVCYALGFTPDFPDDSVVSAWRLRLFPGKSSVSDDFLPK
jgi:hypothetical protein